MKTVAAVTLLFVGTVTVASPDPPPLPCPPPNSRTSPAVALALGRTPDVTHTKDGRAGDPVNLVLVGTRDEVVAAFRAAGWFPAAPTTIRSGLGIAVSVVANVTYRRAPVSDLYLYGRKQNLAFEREVGHSARSRHHLRLWCAGEDGSRPVWVGSATFDARVGRSYTTGRPTHHIDPDVDRERNTAMNDLQRGGTLGGWSLTPAYASRVGRNGEGDCYFTDGNVAVGVLAGRACCK